MNIGIINFGRLKREITGFEIFQNEGFWTDNDIIKKILQLPKEIEFNGNFQNSKLYKVHKVQDKENGQQTILIAVYIYTGLDIDNRETYTGSCIYFKNTIPDLLDLLKRLTELLEISKKQQTDKNLFFENQLLKITNFPNFALKKEIISFIKTPYISIPNQVENEVLTFLESSLNKANYNYQQLFFTSEFNFFDAIKLEKINLFANNQTLPIIEEFENKVDNLEKEISEKDSLIIQIKSEYEKLKLHQSNSNTQIKNISEQLNLATKRNIDLVNQVSSLSNKLSNFRQSDKVEIKSKLFSYFGLLLTLIIITSSFIIAQLEELTLTYKIILAFLPNIIFYLIIKKTNRTY